MTTYISILRGINVSGQKLIRMAALKEMYESLHFKDVRTYIQSGNVIFQAEKTAIRDLEGAISGQIRAYFGFDVPVIVMDAEELTGIIRMNPLSADKAKDIAHLHVTFLASKPAHTNTDKIKDKISPGEEYVLTERAVYLYCPNGYGNSKLTNTLFEQVLKVSATTRNWKTTLELLNMAQGHGPGSTV